MNYIDNLNPKVKEYFNVLSNDFPFWLLDYINTPAMVRIGKIGLSCGADYSSIFDVKLFYSNLEHSVGAALIIWNFTHDKKQTLAGLFHDIATPVFKHCIDFMNSDSEKQESTEELTTQMILDSKEIMSLLQRDNIDISEVNDYKLYPIADNDSPMLSADRFEYNFSCGFSLLDIWTIEEIKEIYDNIIIVNNELGMPEMAFADKQICEKYIQKVSHLWPCWVCDKDRTMMQFYADICKSMQIKGYLTTDELYTLSEAEVINKIKNCEDEYIRNAFLKFQNVKEAYVTDTVLDNKYCINVKSKTRYVNPLVKGEDGSINRIYDVSIESRQIIDDYLKMPKGGYFTYFDFEFKPYNEKRRVKCKN